MKYFIYIFLILFSIVAKGQTSLINMKGAEQITVSADEILHLDGLTLQPTESFTMTSTVIKKLTIPTNTITNSIAKTYTFSNTLFNFSGKIKFNYLNSELNSINETEIAPTYFQDTWVIPLAYSQNTISNQFEYNLDNAHIEEVTLTKRLTPLINNFTDFSLTFGDANQIRSYTSSNTVTATYSSTNLSVATINTNTGSITTTGLGTTTLWLSLADDGTYKAATTSLTLTVNPLGVVVTPALTQSKTFGDADPSLSYTSSPAVGTNLSNGEAIAFSGTLTRTAGEDVGSYSIGIGTLTNTNYTLSYTPADFSITKLPVIIIPTAAQSKTYGLAGAMLTYTTYLKQYAYQYHKYNHLYRKSF